ncbi:ABC transporter ATP-binding protein [Candidatus Synchoanobacter obligatus]|uniref:ABC transporter ATP-binding protein n=1 Tax=Candidatus Synchoanobacter obligatus TaxID=2919597 RepID=A0ABT1L563_9GAMM|nr:ABC transporter ATP-binding protein [Candidatus Synchoanobacter obligatus]MCP8352234.1 ABC transporter ATP-binding protein [Candidatus Synchoanobacter obligatus]
MVSAIEIRDLHKAYAKGTKALDGVSLNIKQGEFFALLGLNGAGKTTLISILVGLVRASSGAVKIFGHDVADDPYMAKRLIGVVPQELNINVFNTVREVMFNHGGFYGLSKVDINQRYEVVLDDLGLLHKRDSMVKELSGGMKRRVLLARALMIEPKVLILDEPTAGVDVDLRQDVWDLLEKINKKGTTILLTTHYMEEAEYLCDSLAILHDGKIIDQGHKDDLLLSDQSRHLVLHLQSEIDTLYEQDYIQAVAKDSKTIELTLQPGADLAAYLQKIESSGKKIGYVSSPKSRLEQYFRSQTT